MALQRTEVASKHLAEGSLVMALLPPYVAEDHAHLSKVKVCNFGIKGYEFQLLKAEVVLEFVTV